MFTNRLFNVLIIIALAAVTALTVRQAVATAVVVQADRTYDQVEVLRARRSDSLLTVDQSYDVVEQVRLQRGASATIADRSYDAIENLRIQRTFR